ncbi:hypothetical protein Bbelb_392720 [Branchiostoma belcheri]|nr:hypothetical protein Bbelb_392720 [Branchiostoma belcheri]
MRGISNRCHHGWRREHKMAAAHGGLKKRGMRPDKTPEVTAVSVRCILKSSSAVVMRPDKTPQQDVQGFLSQPGMTSNDEGFRLPELGADAFVQGVLKAFQVYLSFPDLHYVMRRTGRRVLRVSCPDWRLLSKADEGSANLS